MLGIVTTVPHWRKQRIAYVHVQYGRFTTGTHSETT